MQFKDRIQAIEDRAEAIGISLWALCPMAGVDYSTVHRWRTGEASPNVAALERNLGRLEDKLAEREQLVREKLQLQPAVIDRRPAA